MSRAGGATVRTGYLVGDDHDVFVAVTSPVTRLGGRARRAVVLCPPFGYEHVCAQRTMRVLAERLAVAGHATVVFDPAGRRNSGTRGVGDDHLPAWVASAVLAVRHAATLSDDGVVLVGFRLGSIVAALAAREVRAEALCLVDPTPSGKRHLREQRSLQLMGVASTELVDDPGGLDLLGDRLPSATVASIGRVELAAVAPAAHTFVVSRPAHAGSDRMLDAWRAARTEVESVVDAALAEVYVLGAERARVPSSTLDAVVSWIDGVSSSAVHPPPGAVHLADHVEAVPGVVERIVELGEPRLRGVWCEPAAGAATGRGVLFVNNGAHAEPGPAGAWVAWGRALAAEGVASLRISVRGTGHSDDDDRTDVGPRPVDQFYRPAFADDSRTAAAEVAARVRGDVVVAGLCGSAISGLDLAASAPMVGAALAISPPLDFVPLPVRTGRVNGRVLRWSATWLSDSELGEKVSRHLPDRAWGVLAALHLAPTPASGPLRVARRDVPVVVVGPPEELLVWLPRARRAMRRLVRHPMARVFVGDGFDHAMFRAAGRTAAGEVLLALVRDGLAGVDAVVAGRAAQASASRTASSSADQAIVSLRTVAS